MDLQKEREAFNKEFGIDDADTFPAFSGGIENSAALKCNWLGWKKRAEFEYRENPETIEIEGLKTIHKLCKFGADHNMEGCTFTEIVERMFDELAKAKAQSIPEGFVVVPKEPTQELLNKMQDFFVGAFENGLTGGQSIHCAYIAMIEAQEQTNDK